MELRQLEYFQKVSRLKNITRAAEQLFVTQPAITVAIQKLEEELGVLLFDRSQKHFTLTAEGLIFLQRVDHVLSSLQNAIQEMGDCGQLQKKIIKLGVPPMIGSFLFPPLFADFQKKYPSLGLSTVEAGSVTIRELLERDELDLGIIFVTDSWPLLDTLTITKGAIHVCLPLGHPLSDLPMVPFNLLAEQSFVLFAEGTYHRQVIIKECSRNQITPHIILSSGQIETIRGLVAEGVGISFLPDFIISKYPDIVGRPLAETLPLSIGLAWKKTKYLSNASRSFISFMTNFSPLNTDPEK